jgi:hypothetical protein
MTTATAYNRSTREEWEDGQRRHAEHLIQHGVGYEFEPAYTDEERREVESLKPEAVKVIRRACGRIERELRSRYPAAATAARGIEGPITEESIDRLYKAVDALTGADRNAYDDLQRLRGVRERIRRGVVGRLGCRRWDIAWPERGEKPTCPELDRLDAIAEQAVQRHLDENRARGRQLLADLESGAAWERELKHRADIEEWRRCGPVMVR